MGAETLSDRAIIGRFYRSLEQELGASWIDGVSMMFGSDQDSETYKWIGQVPAMREWIGGRQAKGFTENGITIANKHYEATIEFLLRELRRDKTNQINIRIDEFAQRTNSHWASLLSTLILNGESTVCYDAQFYFDTDHAEGSSGSQSNDLSIDISTLPASVHGSTTIPSLEEMAASILQTVQQILGFKDDRGEPMNEMARKFTVMVPVPLFNTALGAVSLPFFGTGISNLIPNAKNKFEVNVEMNARLTWTEKFATFRTDGSAKPLIRQQETPVQLKAKAAGSEFEFDNDMWQFGVDTWRNVGYGFWQHACLATMV